MTLYLVLEGTEDLQDLACKIASELEGSVKGVHISTEGDEMRVLPLAGTAEELVIKFHKTRGKQAKDTLESDIKVKILKGGESRPAPMIIYRGRTQISKGRVGALIPTLPSKHEMAEFLIWRGVIRKDDEPASAKVELRSGQPCLVFGPAQVGTKLPILHIAMSYRFEPLEVTDTAQ